MYLLTLKHWLDTLLVIQITQTKDDCEYTLKASLQ